MYERDVHILNYTKKENWYDISMDSNKNETSSSKTSKKKISTKKAGKNKLWKISLKYNDRSINEKNE